MVTLMASFTYSGGGSNERCIKVPMNSTFDGEMEIGSSICLTISRDFSYNNCWTRRYDIQHSSESLLNLKKILKNYCDCEKFVTGCSILGHWKTICRRSHRFARRKMWRKSLAKPWGKCLRERFVARFFIWLIDRSIDRFYCYLFLCGWILQLEW